MAHSRRKLLSALVSAGVSIPFLDFTAVAADTAKEIDHRAGAALKKLSQTKPLAKDVSTRAKGILVFPKITKAGFLVGGAYGEGELLHRPLRTLDAVESIHDRGGATHSPTRRRRCLHPNHLRQGAGTVWQADSTR